MKKRIISMLLVVSLLVTMMCSCNLFSKKTVELKNGIPVASGYKNDAEMNTKIEKFYSTVKNQLKDCDGAELVCSVEEHSKGVTLKAQIVRGDVSIDVPNLEITLDGTLRDEDEDLAPYRNGEYLNAALTLKELGMDIDIREYVSDRTTLDVYKLFVEYYDCFRHNNKSADKLELEDKLIELDFADDDKLINDKYFANDGFTLDLMRRLVETMFENVYDNADEEVTYSEILDCAKLFFNAHAELKSAYKDSAEEFIELLEDYMEKENLINTKPKLMDSISCCMKAYYDKHGTPEDLADTVDDALSGQGGIIGLQFAGELSFERMLQNPVAKQSEVPTIAATYEKTLNSMAGKSVEYTTNVQGGQVVIVLGQINEYLENM